MNPPTSTPSVRAAIYARVSSEQQVQEQTIGIQVAALRERVASDALPEQAAVVRQLFAWVGRDRLSIGEVCRRLKQQGISSPQGKSWWDRTTVWGLLKNPAFCGHAAFGKTRVGERRRQLRPHRGHARTARRGFRSPVRSIRL